MSADAFVKGDFLPNGTRRVVPTPTPAGPQLPPPCAGQWKGTITGQTFADVCELFVAALRADNGAHARELALVMSEAIACEMSRAPWIWKLSPLQLADFVADAVLTKVFDATPTANGYQIALSLGP